MMSAPAMRNEPSTSAAPQAMAARRLLVCSAGVPHERDGASVVLFYHYVARLKREGFAIRHLLLLEGETWSAEAVDAYRGKLGDDAFSVSAVRSERLYASGRLSHRHDEEAASALRREAAAFAPDAILCFDFLPAWMLHGALPATPRLVWLGDLNYEGFWEHALYATRENPIRALHLPSMWLSCAAWRRLYGKVLREAAQVIVAAKSSEASLHALGVAAEYEPYPWPEEGSAPRPAAPTDKPTFLFFGQLTGLGSRSAFHFLVDQVFPRLRRRWGAGGFRILIAGRGALPDWVAAAIADKGEVERLGFVADLDALLATCPAVLVPIDVKVGNRSRILTAMAKGALVIAHANTALGNPDLVDGETCFLAHDADGFVARMARAVDEPATRAALAARARAAYQAHYHPEPAGARLARRVRILLEGSPA
jgi:glycosyltransferase involved in cell wall biosynthesis